MDRRSFLAALALGPALAGAACTRPTCATSDVDCILANLYFLDEDGQQVTLVSLPTDRVRGGGGDGGMPAPPSGGLGCFVDGADRDLDGHAASSGAMTVAQCGATCRSRGFRYFGLQGGTWCFCGDRYGRYGRAPDADCYLRCAGNSNEVCGGYLRNSLYATSSIPGAGGSGGGGAVCPGSHPIACGDGSCCDAGHPFCCPGRTCSTSAACGAPSGGGRPTCPNGFPIDCGNGFCCDQGHPVCCPGATCAEKTCGGGTADGLAPQITNTVAPMTFSAAKPENKLPLEWSDPLGCRPALAFTVCRGGACSRRTNCFPVKRDNKLAGATILTLGVKYEPAEESSTFDLQVKPLSAPNWGDPIQMIEAGMSPAPGGSPITGDQAVPIGGAGVTVGVTTTRPPPDPGFGGSMSCQPFSISCSTQRTCTVNACATVTGGGACSAGYRTSDGRWFACAACNNCTAAAGAVNNYCCPRRN